MRIESLVWLEPIVDKLWVKHRVDVEEVREVLQGRPRFRFVEKGHQAGEDVYAAFGQTSSGRFLSVFLIKKPNREALVISARDMTTAERRKYEQK